MKIKLLISALVIGSVALTSCADLYQSSAPVNHRSVSTRQFTRQAPMQSGTYETRGGVQIRDGAFLPGARIAGSLDGPEGTVHMKPGYDYGWETVLETDEYGRVYAVDHMYLTKNGMRITE